MIDRETNTTQVERVQKILSPAGSLVVVVVVITTTTNSHRESPPAARVAHSPKRDFSLRRARERTTAAAARARIIITTMRKHARPAARGRNCIDARCVTLGPQTPLSRGEEPRMCPAAPSAAAQVRPGNSHHRRAFGKASAATRARLALFTMEEALRKSLI